MAQYFVDFNTYANTSEMLTEWTPRWNADTDDYEIYSVESKSCLVISGIADARRALSYNSVNGINNNIEIVFKHKSYGNNTTSDMYFMPALLGSGSASSESAFIATSGYGLDMHLTAQMLSGSLTTSDVTMSAPYLDEANWWWIRFKVVGTTTYYKTWREDVSEPTTWLVTYNFTGSTLPTSALWNGLSNFKTNDGIRAIQCVGFGTNGDSAPQVEPTSPTINGIFKYLNTKRFDRQKLTPTNTAYQIAVNAFFENAPIVGMPVQFNIGGTIIKSTKAQTNINGTIVNLTKGQMNKDGTIVTIWVAS